jgi:hypothetical protein
MENSPVLSIGLDTGFYQRRAAFCNIYLTSLRETGFPLNFFNQADSRRLSALPGKHDHEKKVLSRTLDGTISSLRVYP